MRFTLKLLLLLLWFAGTVFALMYVSGDATTAAADFIAGLAEGNTGLELKIQQIYITDRTVLLRGVTVGVDSGFVQIQIPRIEITYNLKTFFERQFDPRNNIRGIRIEDPVAIIKPQRMSRPETDADAQKKEDEPFRIPDLSPWFQKVELRNGQVVLDWKTPGLRLSDSLFAIQTSFIPGETALLQLVASTGNGFMEASASFDKGQISQVQFHCRDLEPDTLRIDPVGQIRGSLDTDVEWTPENMSWEAVLRNLRGGYRQWTITADSIRTKGTPDRAEFRSGKLRVGSHVVDLNGYVDHPFDSLRTFDSQFAFAVDAEEFYPELKGRIRAEGRLGGRLLDPRVDITVHSDSLNIFGQGIARPVITARYARNQIRYSVRRAEWNQNRFSVNGAWDIGGEGSASIVVPSARYTVNGYTIKGRASADIRFGNDLLEGNVDVRRLAVQNGVFNLENASLQAVLRNDSLLVDFAMADQILRLHLEGNIPDSTLTADIHLKRFQPEALVGSASEKVPFFDGEIHCKAGVNNFVMDARTRFYDDRYGRVDGFLEIKTALDFLHNRSSLRLQTRGARYRYEPFFVTLLADGTCDSIRTRRFDINNMISLQAWIRVQPDLDYGFRLFGSKVPLSSVLVYFMEYYSAMETGGTISADVQYNLWNRDEVKGSIRCDRIGFAPLDSLDARIAITGSPDSIHIPPFSVYSGAHEILKGEGNFVNGILDATVRMDSLELSHLLTDEVDLSGLCRGKVRYRTSDGDVTGNLDFNIKDFRFNIWRLDSLRFIATQNPQILNIHSFNAGSRHLGLTGEGGIGYNLFNGKSIADTSRFRIHYKGDFMRYLSNHVEGLSHGRSDTEGAISMGVDEKGAVIDNAWLHIRDGQLHVPWQLDPVTDIEIACAVSGDFFGINTCRFRTGRGYLYLRNEPVDSGPSFDVGRIHIGRILVSTNQEGVWLYLPGFMPEGGQVGMVIQGRDAAEMKIEGPFDRMSIVGDVLVSHGNVIFPPNARNLFSMITAGDGGDEPAPDLPFTLDIQIRVGENIHYVTNPVNLKIIPGSFVHLLYKDRNFEVREAFFASESGTMEAFGQTFRVEEVDARVGYLQPEPVITGTFFYKTPDGTRITLRIVRAEREGRSGSFQQQSGFQFVLESDDPEDHSTRDILARLRYNRSASQLNEREQDNLLQEEAIYMVGTEIQSELISPFLAPLENWFRRKFWLDTFYIRPGVIRNLFDEYVISKEEDPLQPNETNPELEQIGTSILLNDLRIGMGRYVTDDVFLQYEILFQEETDIRSKQIVPYHDFGVRVDLPWRLNLNYRSRMDRSATIEFHEIMLERSFRFQLNQLTK